MEIKKGWNLRVFASVADAFDDVAAQDFRGDKGTCATAACLMFLAARPEVRQAFVDVVKLAEGRGQSGSILDAARELVRVRKQAGEEWDWIGEDATDESLRDKRPPQDQRDAG